MFLTKKIQNQENMSQIILKVITAPFSQQHFFAKDVEQNKSTSILQVYHPPKTPFPQNTCQKLLSTCEYCEVLRTAFS